MKQLELDQNAFRQKPSLGQQLKKTEEYLILY